MPKVEQNAQSFSYVIRWRRRDITDATWHTATVDRPDAWHYVVPEEQETYKEFDIAVLAKNEKGDSKGLLNVVLGHSGEDGQFTYGWRHGRALVVACDGTVQKLNWCHVCSNVPCLW